MTDSCIKVIIVRNLITIIKKIKEINKKRENEEYLRLMVEGGGILIIK